MSHIRYVEIHQHLPPGVKRIIAHGGGCWIGEVDKTTALKYPHTGEEMKWVRIEAKTLSILGSHPRVVQSKGLTEDGLLLEYARNGNLYDYLTTHPEISLKRLLTWCIQATEAVAYIHSKRVLHCDIRHDNLLLDANLDLKLADFQGQHFSVDGQNLVDALSLESTKAYLPRKPADHASVRTDLFALGCAIYFIMMGHEMFPSLDKSEDEDEIERRFSERDFPTDLHVCTAVTTKCWKQLYLSARQVVIDLEAVQEAITRGETPNSVARNVVSVPNGDASPQATWWVNGLCNDMQTAKAPPPYRQPVGFD